MDEVQTREIVEAATALGQACLVSLRADEGPDETWAERMHSTHLAYQQAADRLWVALGISDEVKAAYGPSFNDQQPTGPHGEAAGGAGR